MAYKIKNKKEYTSGELFGAGVPSNVKDVFKEPKKEKKQDEDDLFSIPKEDEALKQEAYEQDLNDAIDEINNDLYSEQIPIEIKDENYLIVKASGKEHAISRKDLAEYQKQSGSQSGYRQLGSIEGDWRMIEGISTDISYTFNKLDDKLGHYKTAYQEN